MAQKTDLYSILMAYAEKHRSPSIDIDIFTTYLDKYAKRSAAEAPEWKKWTYDFIAKFWNELNGLVENEKCVLRSEGNKNRIFMTEFYAEQVRQAYLAPEKSAELPFPDERSLELTLPPDLVRPLTSRDELPHYLSEPQDTLLPIIKITFTEQFGSALALADMIPGQLLETALIKIQAYLRSHHNRDFFQHKLNPSFTGKELLIKQLFDQINASPVSCIASMESGADFTFLFWSYFSALLIAETKKKSDFLSGEIAAVQAAYLIEVFIEYFKARAAIAREQEAAFKELETRLNQPPYLFGMDDIIKFTNQKGTSLLDYYSTEELDAYLKKKTTEAEPQGLPDFLFIHGKNSEPWVIGRDRIVPLCNQLLLEARVRIKKAIIEHWTVLIREFREEPAMERETAFENLAAKYTAQLSPTLTTFLDDPRLFLLYSSPQYSQTFAPDTIRIFFKGQLLPMTTLLLLKRKDLLAEVRAALPFWYSLPFLSRIIAFFLNLGKNTSRPAPSRSGASPGDGPAAEGESKPLGAALKTLAQNYQDRMVPPGHTPDSYLEELEGRWHRILNKDEQKTLVDDVKNLIRDKLRIVLRRRAYGKLNDETITRIAQGIIAESPTLNQLDDPEALHLYTRLYITKLLMTVKL
jgi:hypothetical protein